MASGSSPDLHIRPYAEADEAAVIALWRACDLTRPWNDPAKDIARKLRVQRELFLVGEADGALVATAMAGYDGHRGWVYYLAVAPECQGRGYGRAVMDEVESRLLALGCPKINLLIRTDNHAAIAFYEAIGFGEDAVRSMGKRLIPDG